MTTRKWQRLVAVLTALLVAMSIVSGLVGTLRAAEAVDEAAIKAYLNEAVDVSIPGYGLAAKHFYPVYGQDTNAIEVVRELLQSKGYDDITVSLKTADARSDYNAGVDSDGTIHYIARDLSTMTLSMHSLQLQTEFTLAKDGISEDFLIKTQVAWDADFLRAQMAPYLVDEATVLGSNDALDNMVNTVTIPKTINWLNTSVTWQPEVSGNKSVTIGGYAAPYTLSFTRNYLTNSGELVFTQYAGFAKVATSRTSAGLAFLEVTSRYPISIPANTDTRTLQVIVNLYRTSHIKLFGTTTIAPQKSTGTMIKSDLQLATSRDLNTDLKGKTLEVISSEPDVITPQAYRAHVYRPWPGSDPVDVTLTPKLTDNETGDFAYASGASRVGTYTVAPLTMAELYAAHDLMNQAEAAYLAGILGTNSDPEQVTADLSSFQEVNASGSDLVWIRNYAGRTFDNVATTELMGSAGQEAYRLFKSSRPDIIAHESLRLVATPQYDTTITIESALTHQQFAKYAERLAPDDTSEYAMIIRDLVYRPVAATITVPGRDGADPDEGYVTGTFTVIGSALLTEAADHATALHTWYSDAYRLPAGATLLDLTKAMLDRPDDGFGLRENFGFVTAITVPGMGTNTYQITNGMGSSWMWYYLDAAGERQAGQEGASTYILQAGDDIVWEFMNDPSYPYGVTQESPDTPIELEATPDHWTGFAKDEENNAVFESDQVTVPAKQPTWQAHVAEQDDWGMSMNSDYLVIGEHIFVANGQTLYKLDKAGNTVATAALRASMGYFARLAYANGMVVVPLQGGALQAVRARDLETMWVADSQKYVAWEPDAAGIWQPVYYDVQNNSSTYIADGYAYTATIALDSSWSGIGGLLRSVNMATGETRWIRDIPAGFYWSGPVKSGDVLIIAGDDGVLRAIDTTTGQDVASLNVGACVRSTIVKQGHTLYFSDRAGHLHKVIYDTTSKTFGHAEKVKFADGSTSTPAIYGGKAYVGSHSGFHVIDLNTMRVLDTFTTAGVVQATPLVIPRSDGQVFVYFNVNEARGAMYVYDGTTVDIAFLPPAGAQNYTTSSVVVGQDGTLYYTNDSGVIFALRDERTAALLTLDTSQLTGSFISSVAIRTINGDVLRDGTLRVALDQDGARQQAAQSQFGSASFLLLDVSLVESRQRMGILSEDSTVELDITLADDFTAGAASLQLLRYNPQSGRYDVVSNQPRLVTFDPARTNQFALLANKKTSTTETPEPTETTKPSETTKPTPGETTKPTEAPTVDTVPKTGEMATPLFVTTGITLIVVALAIAVAKRRARQD